MMILIESHNADVVVLSDETRGFSVSVVLSSNAWSSLLHRWDFEPVLRLLLRYVCDDEISDDDDSFSYRIQHHVGSEGPIRFA